MCEIARANTTSRIFLTIHCIYVSVLLEIPTDMFRSEYTRGVHEPPRVQKKNPLKIERGDIDAVVKTVKLFLWRLKYSPVSSRCIAPLSLSSPPPPPPSAALPTYDGIEKYFGRSYAQRTTAAANGKAGGGGGEGGIRGQRKMEERARKSEGKIAGKRSNLGGSNIPLK